MTTTSSSPTTQQFLRFHLPDQGLVMVPTQQLAEILSLAVNQVVPIPEMPPAVMGVCNWRGEVLWLADLGYLLGFTPLSAQRSAQGVYHAIIIHSQGRSVGLVVEHLDQMVWCDPNQIQPAPALSGSPELTRCVQGFWSASKGELVMVLNGHAIIESLAHSH